MTEFDKEPLTFNNPIDEANLQICQFFKGPYVIYVTGTDGGTGKHDQTMDSVRFLFQNTYHYTVITVHKEIFSTEYRNEVIGKALINETNFAYNFGFTEIIWVGFSAGANAIAWAYANTENPAHKIHLYAPTKFDGPQHFIDSFPKKEKKATHIVAFGSIDDQSFFLKQPDLSDITHDDVKIISYDKSDINDDIDKKITDHVLEAELNKKHFTFIILNNHDNLLLLQEKKFDDLLYPHAKMNMHLYLLKHD